MIDLETIQTAVNLGKSYYIELVDELHTNLLNGCTTCCDSDLNCLRYCINTLQYDIDTDTNTDTTQSTYLILLGITAGFSGSYSPDPTVVTNETVITVVTDAVDITKTQADLIEDGVGSGNWYLLFLDEDGNSLPSTARIVLVTYNGTTLTGWTYTSSTNRIYSFPSNSTATIVITYVTVS